MFYMMFLSFYEDQFVKFFVSWGFRDYMHLSVLVRVLLQFGSHVVVAN
jgi:hypothetical protein